MAISFIRTVILYVLLIAGVRLMGKRQIGELQPGELVVTILISELVAIPMQETNVPLVNGIVPLLTIVFCEILLSQISLHSMKLRKFISGNASVIIKNGKLCQAEMRRMRLTIDDLMEELRLAGYASVGEVNYAILETNGRLSVFAKPEKEPVNNESLNIQQKNTGIHYPIISDGRVLSENLTFYQKDVNWLNHTLEKLKVELKDIFMLTVNQKGEIFWVPKEKIKKAESP